MLRCKRRWVLPVGGTGGCGTKCRAGCCCWTCRQARCPSRCRTAAWHWHRQHSCRQPSALAGLAPLRRRLYCCVNGIGSRRLYGLHLGLYLGLLCRLDTRRCCCRPAQRYRRLRGGRSSSGRLSLRAVAMAGRWCRCRCWCWCWSGAGSGQHQPVLLRPGEDSRGGTQQTTTTTSHICHDQARQQQCQGLRLPPMPLPAASQPSM